MSTSDEVDEQRNSTVRPCRLSLVLLWLCGFLEYRYSITNFEFDAILKSMPPVLFTITAGLRKQILSIVILYSSYEDVLHILKTLQKYPHFGLQSQSIHNKWVYKLLCERDCRATLQQFTAPPNEPGASKPKKPEYKSLYRSLFFTPNYCVKGIPSNPKCSNISLEIKDYPQYSVRNHRFIKGKPPEDSLNRKTTDALSNSAFQPEVEPLPFFLPGVPPFLCPPACPLLPPWRSPFFST